MDTQNALEKLRSLRAQAAALVAVVVLTYLPTLRGKFIWDDDANIVNAIVVRSVQGLWRIWAEPGATQQYYPLTHTTFWVEYQLWGPSPLPYHVTNIVLHAASALLLWTLLRRLEVPGALLGALIWAVHPLQAESVAWIVERKNCLSGGLVLASLLLYERFLRSDGKQRWTRYGGALLLFVLALLAKTAVVGVPIVMVAIAWWRHSERSSKTRHVLQVLPFAIVAVAAGLTTGWLEVHHLQAYGPEFGWTALQRVFIATHALWFYAGKMILPVGLAFVYPRWGVDPALVGPWVHVAMTVAAFVALIVFRKKVPAGVTVGLASYVVMIAPALGLTNIYFMRFSFAQNHFQYFAGMAGAALIGAGLWKLAQRFGAADSVRSVAAAGVVVALLAAGCVREGLAFKDDEALYVGAIRSNPDAWMAHYNLGLDRLKHHRSEEAGQHFLQVLRVRPDDIDAMTNLGIALAEQRRSEEAAVVFEEIVRRKPESAEAHLNAGLARDGIGQSEAAVRHLRRALALKPDMTRAERVLAWVLATDPDERLRNGPEAVELATRACAKTKKAVARCLDTLAAAYAEAGRYPEAVKTATDAEVAAVQARDGKAAETIRARRASYEAGKPYRRQHHARTSED